MDTEETSIFFVIVLSVGGLSMMTLLLACYVCIFRDLCCRSRSFWLGQAGSTTRGRHKSRKASDESEAGHKQDVLALADYTQQAESMPTESEHLQMYSS